MTRPLSEVQESLAELHDFLARAPRVNSVGLPARPEEVDRPEGTLTVRLSATQVARMTAQLQAAMLTLEQLESYHEELWNTLDTALGVREPGNL